MKRGPDNLAECIRVPADALRGERWDPAFWNPPDPALTRLRALPCAPLGDFIERITYGPILTGRRPQPVPDGVAIIDQKVLRPTGVLLAQAIRVAEGSDYDLPRCRLREGDLVLARSGAGTLRRKRFTVFSESAKATVSCFVDLIRLRGINPYYVATFLRSPLGWSQVGRLINGVGTPNLSFGEVRSLLIPCLDERGQRAVEAAWAPIRAAHAAGSIEAAEALLDDAAGNLEKQLTAHGSQHRGCE